MALLEEVFTLSGIPTITFVEPSRFQEIKVSLRTPGRCMVIEGPSGIGKTTTVTKAIAELDVNQNFLTLSARKRADIELINELPEMRAIGQVIVDDFHRLPDEIKVRLSDFMKVLADSQDAGSKLILIGINKAGQQLVKFAHDLGLRIDVFRLETNSEEKILELIGLGETALNVTILSADKVAERSQRSFQIAQLLCHKMCVLNRVIETVATHKEIETSINVAIEDVMVDLARQFKEAALTFARGSKLRKEGRAPYLHILRWLADSDEWSLDLSAALILFEDIEGYESDAIIKDGAYLFAPSLSRVLINGLGAEVRPYHEDTEWVKGAVEGRSSRKWPVGEHLSPSFQASRMYAFVLFVRHFSQSFPDAARCIFVVDFEGLENRIVRETRGFDFRGEKRASTSKRRFRLEIALEKLMGDGASETAASLLNPILRLFGGTEVDANFVRRKVLD
jgi:hypothetical protein